MKKINLLIAAGLMASASMQAQTVVTSLGFEANDPKGQSTEWALTPGLSIFGDWVNVQDVDSWDEQSQEDVHSGSYALKAVNGDGGSEQSYFRGFKIAKLGIEENTAYRVSMWVNANEGARFTSWISKGVENYDKSICTASGQNFGINDIRLAGGWQHVSFVSFYRDAQTMEDGIVASNETWRGDGKLPEQFGGDGEKKYKDQFDNHLPDEFFFIANMFSNNTTYILDDIKIEKGVTFNQATFNDESFVVKLDFGYTTNIGKLAKATVDGIAFFDKSCVDLSIDGVPSNDKILYVEGHTDGFLYIFLDDETVNIAPESVVKVGFKGEPTIFYDGDKRPSADYETDMNVLPFSDELAYYDFNLDVVSNEWIAPKFVKSVPENESFEIVSATFKNVAVTYDKPVDITMSSATLVKNGVQTDLTDGISLSADGMTVNVAVSNLADGEYNFILDNVTNALGIPADNVELTFAVGPDTDDTKSESVYSTNETFAATANGTFPVGWVSNDNGTIHQYGVFGEDTQWAGQVYNYNWGNNMKQAFNQEGGCRAMTGYSGDLNGGAIYWRCMNDPNILGTLTFGEQVKDYIDGSGNIDPEMPKGISLYLEPKKYQITIRMCAWKNLNGNTQAVNEENAPKYSFTLEDLSGKVYARFDDVKAMPNVNGAQNTSVTNVTRSQTDFTVEKAGYYMLKFSSTQGSAELLLGGVDLVTMPSKAAYWKQQLAAAVEPAKSVLAEAEDESYNGDTKTALAAAIAEAEAGGFTSPSEVNAEIDKLRAASAKMTARIDNLDKFQTSQLTAIAAYGDLVGTKYEAVDVVKAAKALIDQYGEVDPSTLSDEALAEVTPRLVSVASKLGNVVACTDLLTWGIYKARQTYEKIGADNESAYNAALAAVSDDRDVADALNKANTLRVVEILAKANGGVIPAEFLTKVAADGSVVTDEESAYDFAGIELTGCVQNPKFYRVYGDNGVPGWTITPGSDETNLNIAFNTSATEENYVVDAQIQIYGNADYDFSQILTGLPAGIYNVQIYTRTPLVDKTDTYGKIFYYNAQNDETGVWDKYIFAVGDDEPAVEPYTGAGGLTSTVIKGIKVDESGMVIGAHEHYVSKKAERHEDNTPQDFWTGTTYVDDVHVYLVAPLEGHNYEEDATSIQNIEAAASKKANAIYNLAGQRVDASYKGIVIKNGKKVLNK